MFQNHHLDDQKHDKKNDPKNNDQIQVTLSHHVPSANRPERYATLWDLRFFGRIRWEFFFGWKDPRRSFGSFFSNDLGLGKFSFKKLGSNDPIQFTSTPTNLSFKEAEHKKSTLGSWYIPRVLDGFLGHLGTVWYTGDGGQKTWKVICGK